MLSSLTFLIFAEIKYYIDKVASWEFGILQLQKLMSGKVLALQYLGAVHMEVSRPG